MLKVLNDRNLRQIQHLQRQNNVFIHTRSHVSWHKMENGVNVTSMTVLTKQWGRRESGAISTHAVDCWKFLECLANSERQYSLFLFKVKGRFLRMSLPEFTMRQPLSALQFHLSFNRDGKEKWLPTFPSGRPPSQSSSTVNVPP